MQDKIGNVPVRDKVTTPVSNVTDAIAYLRNQERLTDVVIIALTLEGDVLVTMTDMPPKEERDLMAVAEDMLGFTSAVRGR